MANDFMPREQQKFFGWQGTLVGKINDNKVPWNIPGPALTELLNEQSNYQAKYADGALPSKGVRTPQQTAAFNKAEKNYKTFLRNFLKQFITFSSLVSDDDRVAMDLPVRDTTPTRGKAPEAMPDIFVTPLKGARLKVSVRQQPDKEGVSQRGKPDGVGRFEIAWKVGDPPPNHGDDCAGRLISGKSPATITIDTDNIGKRITIFVRWISTNNLPGPWCEPQDSVVPK